MRKGQGLMETIVALGVIMTGLVSVISLTISNLNAERDAATRYQAINLAREAIELVRNIRDSNWVSGAYSWEGVTEGADLALVFNPQISTVALSAVGDRQVRQCGNDHFAQGSASCIDSTLFSRTVTTDLRNCIEMPEIAAQCGEINKPDPVALAVTAKVTWQTSGGGLREITLDEIFYDWR